MRPEDTRALFPVFRDLAYLDFAGIAPLPTVAVDVVTHAARRVAARGVLDADAAAEEIEDVRGRAASLCGARPEEICFVRNTTEGLGWVANGLGLGPGDRVVVSGGEFPSTYFPWVALREVGVRVDVVEPVGGRWPLERFAAALAAGPPARVLATSWVQFSNGWRTDLAALGSLCAEAGTLLCADVIQGLGAVPLDLDALPVDFAMADGHKWLCGPEGVGVMYVAAAHMERLRPLEPGWNSVAHRMEWDNLAYVPDSSARRFEGGSPNVLGVLALGASLGLLAAVGSRAVWERISALAATTVSILEARGMDVLSDRSPEHASGIVVFRHPAREPGGVVEALRGRGVVVTGPRGGGVRVSPHAWCNEDDLDRLDEGLASC